MKLRHCAILAGAASMGLTGSRATADFLVTAVRTDLGAANTITNSGNGVVPGYLGLTRFYARNLGASGTVNQGTKLSSVSITMSDTGPGFLVVGGYNRASGNPQPSDTADLFGQHEISVVGGQYVYKETLTTTTNAPNYVSFFNILGSATVAGDNNPNQTLLSPGGFTPANTSTNYGYAIKSFSADYSGINTGVDATTSNGGLGALFAVAVAPITDTINVTGQFGGDMSLQTTPFNFNSSVLPGDANLDGTVNLADAQILKANWNLASGAAWSKGDFTEDGVINGTDALVLGRNFGAVSGSVAPASAMLEAAAVPEPATLSCLVLLGGAALLPRRRRSK